MAWTSSGMGTVQLVECCSIRTLPKSRNAVGASAGASAIAGSFGRMTLTGHLGDVLEESAQIALTWVRSACSTAMAGKRGRAATGDAAAVYEAAMFSDIHVHLPSGSVPKDGPSAGVTLAVALTSLFFGVRCRADTAMTGEISLTGAVLPVGGVAEKVRAAHKSGMTRVIVPDNCYEEATGALKEVRGRGKNAAAAAEVVMEVIPVKTVEEAIEAAIVGGNPWNWVTATDAPVLSHPVSAKL